MDKALYVAMTGAAQNMLSQQGHANNLANVNTTAFKADWMQSRSMPVFGEYYPSRAYAMTERPATNVEQGSMIQTGRELDVAFAGKGLLAVQAPDGTEAFTREGELQIDVNGILRTGSGLPVLGNGGPLAVPPAAKVVIGGDGTVSVIGLGDGPQELAEIDRIKLVNPAADQLVKGEDGLMRLKPDAATAGQPVPADGFVKLQAGYLEASNVNAVEEMTEILSLSRQFELQVKLMRMADQNAETAARLLQIS